MESTARLADTNNVNCKKMQSVPLNSHRRSYFTGYENPTLRVLLSVEGGPSAGGVYVVYRLPLPQ